MRTRSKFASLTVYGACGANAVPGKLGMRVHRATAMPDFPLGATRVYNRSANTYRIDQR